MHVIWKRPDGYHGASPSDYRIVELGGHSKIWLHKTDHLWFPFRVSGGWQDEESTKQLNRFVNLIGAPDAEWLECLLEAFGHSQSNDGGAYISDTQGWLSELKNNLKGDTWEVEIMETALSEIEQQLQKKKAAFLARVGS